MNNDKCLVAAGWVPVSNYNRLEVDRAVCGCLCVHRYLFLNCLTPEVLEWRPAEMPNKKFQFSLLIQTFCLWDRFFRKPWYLEYKVFVKAHNGVDNVLHVILVNSAKYISKKYPSFTSLKVYKARRNGTSFMWKTHWVYCLDVEKATREWSSVHPIDPHPLPHYPDISSPLLIPGLSKEQVIVQRGTGTQN